MAITDSDVHRIAILARIQLPSGQTDQARQEMNGILGLIAELQAVDTSGITPMAHPLEASQDIHLRLRDDAASETQSPEQRDALMANAPARENGLFLVPTVIE